MTASRGKIIASAVVILISAGSIFFTVWPSTPPADLLAHEGLGGALAQLALKAASGGGKIVLVAPDTSTYPNRHFDAQMKAFHRALRAANQSVAVTNIIKLNALQLVRVPPGDFALLLRKRNEKDVVVSLMGPPLIPPAERAKLPAKLPRIIAVCAGDTPLQVPMKALFDGGLLETAILSRGGTLPGNVESAAQAFEKTFRVVTASDGADFKKEGGS